MTGWSRIRSKTRRDAEEAEIQQQLVSHHDPTVDQGVLLNPSIEADLLVEEEPSDSDSNSELEPEEIAEEPSDFEPETPFGPEHGEYLESLSDSEATQALEAMDRDELLSLSDLLYSIGEDRTSKQERLYNLIQDILLDEGFFLPDDPFAE